MGRMPFGETRSGFVRNIMFSQAVHIPATDLEVSETPSKKLCTGSSYRSAARFAAATSSCFSGELPSGMGSKRRARTPHGEHSFKLTNLQLQPSAATKPKTGNKG